MLTKKLWKNEEYVVVHCCVEEIKDIAHVEDSQPDQETSAQNLEKLPERSTNNTQIKDSSKELSIDSLTNGSSSTLRRRFKLASRFTTSS